MKWKPEYEKSLTPSQLKLIQFAGEISLCQDIPDEASLISHIATGDQDVFIVNPDGSLENLTLTPRPQPRQSFQETIFRMSETFFYDYLLISAITSKY